MADTDSTWAVPTLDDLQNLAEDLAEGEHAEYFVALYGEPIQEVLRDIQDVGLSDEMKARLEELYEAWEAEGFPHQEADEDETTEGDPDLLPDPEDV